MGRLTGEYLKIFEGKTKILVTGIYIIVIHGKAKTLIFNHGEHLNKRNVRRNPIHVLEI